MFNRNPMSVELTIDGRTVRICRNGDGSKKAIIQILMDAYLEMEDERELEELQRQHDDLAARAAEDEEWLDEEQRVNEEIFDKLFAPTY